MNPIIQRFSETQKRRGTVGVLAAIYVMCLVFFAIWAVPPEHIAPNERTITFLTRFYAELWLLLMTLFLWAAMQAAREIPREVERKSYDFFRLLPLPPRTKVLGIVLGVNRPLFLFIGINIVLMTLLVPASSLKLTHHLQLTLVTTCVGGLLLFSSFLLSTVGQGIWSLKGAGLFRILLLLWLVMTAVPILIGLTMALADGVDDASSPGNIPFFNLEIPLWLFLCLSCLYFGSWAYAACLRRFRQEDAPVVPRQGGSLFLAGSSLYSLGLGWPVAGQSEANFGKFIVVVMTGGIGLLVVTLAARRSVVDYMEERKRRARPLREIWWQISNLTTSGVFLVVAALGWFALGLAQKERGHAVALSLVATIIFVFFALLSELHTVSRTRMAHPTLILGFVLFGYFLFPLIASLSLDADLYVLSSFDYFFVLIADRKDAMAHFGPMLFINAGYCALLALFIGRRYARLSALALRLG